MLSLKILEVFLYIFMSVVKFKVQCELSVSVPVAFFFFLCRIPDFQKKASLACCSH